MFATFPLARGQRQVPATLAACVIHGVGIAAVVIFAGTQLKAAPTVDPYEKIVFVVPPPAAGHSDGVDAPGAPKAAPWPSITPEPLMLDDLRAMTAVETGSLIGPPVPGALVSVTGLGGPDARVEPASTLVVPDEPAVLIEPPVLDYPPVMRNVGLAGLVVLEFVVDSLGKVEAGSVRVQETTHPAFTAAVLKALPEARFRPGRSGGQPVRQLVRQSFRFVQ